jgi:hypothetical protein
MSLRPAAALVLLLGVCPAATAQKFLPDDPIAVDRDDRPVERPGEVELSTTWDVIEHSFWHRPAGRIPAAERRHAGRGARLEPFRSHRARELSLEELRGRNSGGLPRNLDRHRGEAPGITASRSGTRAATCTS